MMDITNATVQLVTALLGTLGFSVLFRVSPKKLPFAAIGGLLTYAVYLVFDLWFASPLVSGFAASLFMALYSEILARSLRAPAIIFMLPCAIPIVPGSYLYYTMYNFIFNDFEKFVSYGKTTLSIILGMAVGMSVASIIVGAVIKVMQLVKPKKQNKKC